MSTETIDSGRRKRSLTSGHSPTGRSSRSIVARASSSARSCEEALPMRIVSPSERRMTTRR